jgi:hypothetical protein
MHSSGVHVPSQQQQQGQGTEAGQQGQGDEQGQAQGDSEEGDSGWPAVSAAAAGTAGKS